MRDYDSDWSLRISEVKIENEDIQYTLVVGYVGGDHLDEIQKASIYVRLYDESNNLIIGAWLSNFDEEITHRAKLRYMAPIAPELVQQVKIQAKRLEALKIFA